MTIQCQSAWAAKSKKDLQAALNMAPNEIKFYEPSIVAERHFNGDQIERGQKFPCVLDPQTRHRFAMVIRKLDGTFKVL